MEKSQFTSNALAGLLIGLSLIVGTAIAAYAFYQVKSLNNVIAVTGTAEQVITSDTAKWTSNFSRNVDAAALKDGNVQIQQDLKTVVQYLHDHGVTNSEITVQPPTVQSVCANQNNIQYDKSGNTLCSADNTSGYSLQQSVIVESTDVQKIQQVANEASGALIDKGLVFTTNGVEYYYNKLDDLKLQMLADATKNAQDRASKIVQSTGAQLGNLQSSQEGVFQVTAVNSTEISDYGAYDTTTIQKKVTALVRASFTLK